MKNNRIFKAKIHKHGVRYIITFTELSFYEYFMSNYYSQWFIVSNFIIYLSRPEQEQETEMTKLGNVRYSL